MRALFDWSDPSSAVLPMWRTFNIIAVRCDMQNRAVVAVREEKGKDYDATRKWPQCCIPKSIYKIGFAIDDFDAVKTRVVFLDIEAAKAHVDTIMAELGYKTIHLDLRVLL